MLYSETFIQASNWLSTAIISSKVKMVETWFQVESNLKGTRAFQKIRQCTYLKCRAYRNWFRYHRFSTRCNLLQEFPLLIRSAKIWFLVHPYCTTVLYWVLPSVLPHLLWCNSADLLLVCEWEGGRNFKKGKQQPFSIHSSIGGDACKISFQKSRLCFSLHWTQSWETCRHAGLSFQSLITTDSLQGSPTSGQVFRIRVVSAITMVELVQYLILFLSWKIDLLACVHRVASL